VKKGNLAKAMVAFTALIFVYFEAKKKLKNYDINQVIYLLSSLSTGRIIVLFILGLMAVSTMTLYDYFLIKHLKYKFSLFKVWKISWIANTFNNFLSFAGMTGAAIRTLLYKKNNISSKEAVYASVILAPSTVIGISAASWLIIFNILKGRDILMKYKILWLGVIWFAVYLPLYFLLYKWEWLNKKVMARINEYNRDTMELRNKLIASSLIEWISVGLLFFFICITFTKKITIFEAIGILSVSAIAGIMSFIPGGMGSYDLICILGLQTMGAPCESAAAILITFRICYYIVPWLIGVILGISEIITKEH
jgi:uncharacterized membrane protein YbhN (UPF0104 family)